MACVINYKNKTYSLEDFKNVLLQEPSLVKEIANKSQERLKAIQEVFNANPELSKMGNVFSYATYLDTMFPDSKVKDVVYHGTGKEFNEFSREIAKQRTGFHFTTKIGLENSRFNFPKTNKTVILNITNPLKTDDLGGNFKWAKDNLLKQGNVEDANKTKGWDIEKENNPNSDGFIYINKAENEGYGEQSYMVFEPEQIHILGSQSDIEGFKNWVDNFQKVSSNSSQQVQQDFNISTDIDSFAEEAFECK